MTVIALIKSSCSSCCIFVFTNTNSENNTHINALEDLVKYVSIEINSRGVKSSQSLLGTIVLTVRLAEIIYFYYEFAKC